MDNSSAALLLQHLLERIVLDPQSNKYQIPGYLSSYELSAIKQAVSTLQPASSQSHQNPDEILLPGEETHAKAPSVVCDISLNLSSLSHENFRKGVMLCLDFGTAMSKAFATTYDDDVLFPNIRLPIARRVSKSGMLYTIPSSIWISEDGAITFGEAAVINSLSSDVKRRQRFDSPKKELTQGIVETPLDRIPLSREINPTDVSFSKGDAITLYLGYLTFLACSELNQKLQMSEYVLRRFALPSWDKDRRSWGEKMLGKMLAKAQILADTFFENWQTSIDIKEARAAIDKINLLPELPTHLIDVGVAEPLAAASSRLRKEQTSRGLVIVVDIGAGTSDFAMFVVSEDPEAVIYRAWPIEGCSESLHQAGDTLDIALQQSILEKANVESGNPDYDLIVANLRLRIRALKEELFKNGKCVFTLSNGERDTIEMQDFLEKPAVKRFGELLSITFRKVLDCAHISFYQRFDANKITVVFTGGGADLPMVKELANGWYGNGGYKLKKERAPLVPYEFSEDPELSFVYPQLAVAIGGAQPDMVNESSAIHEMPGLAIGGWTIGRY
jgi:hypothetical protein